MYNVPLEKFLSNLKTMADINAKRIAYLMQLQFGIITQNFCKNCRKKIKKRAF